MNAFSGGELIGAVSVEYSGSGGALRMFHG